MTKQTGMTKSKKTALMDGASKRPGFPTVRFHGLSEIISACQGGHRKKSSKEVKGKDQCSSTSFPNDTWRTC
jgi:hypothetical protein